LSRLSPQVQLALAIAVPLLSLIAFCLLVFPKWTQYQRDRDELEGVSARVSVKRDLIQRAETRGPIPPVTARAPATREEPVDFLTELNNVAAESRVRIASVSQSAAPVPPPAPAPPAGGAANPTGTPPAPATGLPPDTTPAALQVSVAGSFQAMGRFFANLETHRRLVSINNVTMSGQGDDLTANFLLVRYVGGPPADVATVTPAQ
jgi:hypothetical protein